MKKSILNRLSKIINMPLNTIGLALVRTSANRTRSMPSWKVRMEHAKRLGFSPRVIFDGGAFRGLWSRTAAQLFPGAAIVLIEPNPYMQESIKKNISHISPPPKSINLALGESPGKAKLNIWHEEESDAGSSLLGHVRGNARKVIEVKVLKHAEFFVIEFGCLEAYIGRTTPRDLFEVMYNNGYCLYDIVDCHYRPYDGALTGGDFFFVKNDSVLRNYKGWE